MRWRKVEERRLGVRFGSLGKGKTSCGYKSLGWIGLLKATKILDFFILCL